MIRRLLGIDRNAAAGSDDFGPVCPWCGRYDWPTMAVVPTPCRTGVHRAKRCAGCDHFEVRYDCEGH